MRLEGSLDAFSLPDIFSLLSMTKKTGGLHLRRAEQHGVVWLGDGLITGGASDLSRLSLGRRLAGSGHVADNHLTAAVDEVAKNPDLGVARALRDHNSIDEGELHTMVCEHIVDTVFDLMRWSDGVFEFVIDEANIDDVGVTRDVDEVVVDARRRLDQWTSIDDRIADSGTVLSLALDLAVESQVQRDEWELLALIDGRRTVGDIVSLFGRGEYAIVIALAELVGRGLVRVNDSEGIAAMLRRQDLIASLESGTATVVSDAAQPPAPAPAVAEPVQDTVVPVVIEADAEPTVAMPEAEAPAIAEASAGADADLEIAAPAPAVAEATSDVAVESCAESFVEDTTLSIVAEPDAAEDADDDVNSGATQVASLPRLGVARDLSAVTPQRPEPFITGREPEHPEPLAAAMAAGGAVASPMPVGAIERDPSVNKSLLLRLIAGVRGL